jgi:NAD(P)-dependent dehydrogenase (short-subunit alcohol dehydrogenase family)
MRLTEKVALVTGGSRGMGRAICLGLAREGARVAVNYVRRADAAGEVVARIRGGGGEAVAIQGDVSRRGDAEALVAETLKRCGGLDILVNVAGVAVFGDFFAATEEDWDRQMDVNAKGVFLASQASARRMREAGGGRIVIVSSISGDRADAALVPYCASKGAASMLTKAMAVALAPYNITVNAVLPGTVETDMNAPNLARPELRGAILAGTPLGRLGRPEDVVGAVLYLCSDEAAWTTGSSIVVDGGFMA